MSKLEQLIENLCPSGVMYEKISDICNISRGIVISKEDIISNMGDFPVYSSQTENDGELGRISTYAYEGEYLTWTTDGANAGTVFYRTGKFSVTNVCGLLKVVNSDCLARYIYYVLSLEAPKYVRRGMGNPKLMSNVMGNITIPLPPLEIQREIIRILDTFVELTLEITSEFIDRKQQYKFYSTALFDNAKKSGVAFIKDVCTVEKGKTPIQKATPGEYPMVVTTTERKSCDSYQFDTKAVCIPLVSSRGHGVASLNHVYYQEGKFALGNILCALIPINEEQLFPRYLYYYFEQTKDYTLVPLMKGGANVALHMKDIEKVKIPIPTLAEQKRIVDILDRFDYICNDTVEGIPAEIAQRQQQYEYYRDKLLTFKNINAEV